MTAHHSIIPWIRALFQLLPQRLQRAFYYRVLSKFRGRLTGWFVNAPLKLVPSIRMNLCWKDSSHGAIAFTGLYEDDVSNKIQSVAKSSGGLLVDVGANYGYYSLFWCPARAGNRAFAVEASRANIAALHKNVSINNMEDRITVCEWAASNREGQVDFDLGSDEETGWGGIATAANADTITVACHRLDQFFAGQDISVLKIDCEGADALVLEGASALLAAHRIHHVFFEENIHRQALLGIEAGSAVRLLQKLGYRCEVIGPGDESRNYHAYLA